MSTRVLRPLKVRTLQLKKVTRVDLHSQYPETAKLIEKLLRTKMSSAQGWDMPSSSSRWPPIDLWKPRHRKSHGKQSWGLLDIWKSVILCGPYGCFSQEVWPGSEEVFSCRFYLFLVSLPATQKKSIRHGQDWVLDQPITLKPDLMASGHRILHTDEIDAWQMAFLRYIFLL